jgi:hypothetical protein
MGANWSRFCLSPNMPAGSPRFDILAKETTMNVTERPTGRRLTFSVLVLMAAACESPTAAIPLPSFATAPPDPSSITVESNGAFEIYTWRDSEGNQYRIVDEYNTGDRPIRSSAFLNGTLVGRSDLRRSGGQIRDARTDSDGIPTREWTKHDQNLALWETSFGRECIYDPMRRECVGQYFFPATPHPCQHLFEQWIGASFLMLNRTAALGIRTRRRVPSVDEVGEWGGIVAYWWVSMWRMDRCTFEHGRPPRGGGPYAVKGDDIQTGDFSIAPRKTQIPV